MATTVLSRTPNWPIIAAGHRRPNNDTLYTIALIDVTEEPVVLEMPAFDSTYVSLMVTGYDHYVNIPMSTTLGDFDEPANILFYSERTPGYDGAPVEGVDMVMEMTGDFVSAVFRVMPHAAEPERLERNLAAMRSVDVEPLSEFLGQGDGSRMSGPGAAPAASAATWTCAKTPPGSRPMARISRSSRIASSRSCSSS